MTTTGPSSISRSRWILILAAALAASAWACRGGRTRTVTTANPELEYLKALNQQPPRDSQLLFLLMAQYANANRHREGAEFLQSRLDQFGPRMTDVQKSLYLSAIAALRAGAANDVPFLKRIRLGQRHGRHAPASQEIVGRKRVYRAVGIRSGLRSTAADLSREGDGPLGPRLVRGQCRPGARAGIHE
jgi:hypothetical protein